MEKRRRFDLVLNPKISSSRLSPTLIFAANFLKEFLSLEFIFIAFSFLTAFSFFTAWFFVTRGVLRIDVIPFRINVVLLRIYDNDQIFSSLTEVEKTVGQVQEVGSSFIDVTQKILEVVGGGLKPAIDVALPIAKQAGQQAVKIASPANSEALSVKIPN